MGLWGKAITIAKSATVPKKPLFYRELSPKSDHNEKSATVPKKPFFWWELSPKSDHNEKSATVPKKPFFWWELSPKVRQNPKNRFFRDPSPKCMHAKILFWAFWGGLF